MFSTFVEMVRSNLTNRFSLEAKLLHGKHTCEQILGFSRTEFLLILSSRYGCLSLVLFSPRCIRLHVILDAQLKYNTFVFNYNIFIRLDTRLVLKIHIDRIN